MAAELKAVQDNKTGKPGPETGNPKQDTGNGGKTALGPLAQAVKAGAQVGAPAPKMPEPLDEGAAGAGAALPGRIAGSPQGEENKNAAIKTLLVALKSPRMDTTGEMRLKAAAMLAKIGGPEIAKELALAMNCVIYDPQWRADRETTKKAVEEIKEHLFVLARRHGKDAIPHLTEALMIDKVEWTGGSGSAEVLSNHLTPVLQIITEIGVEDSLPILHEAAGKYPNMMPHILNLIEWVLDQTNK